MTPRFAVTESALGNIIDPNQGAGLLGFVYDGTGAEGRSVADRLSDMISAKDFGAVGDGAADDTSALTLAIAAAASETKCLYLPAGTYRITGGLSTPSGFKGICGDSQSSSTLLVEGTGYAALTITTGTVYQRFNVEGSDNTANGILFSGLDDGLGGMCAWMAVREVRVYNLDGYGIKINNVFDSLFDRISVELCGNDTEYAFSVNCNSGDTTNMSLFSSLQVEQANRKAIYIDPDTLSCVFLNIHSERATPNAADDTWILGGNNCSYQGVRLTSNATVTDSSCTLTGAQNYYANILTEGAIPVSVEGANGNHISIIDAEIQGTLSVVTDQIGTINIFGANIVTLSGSAINYRIYGGKITTLRVGYANDDPNAMKLFGVNIGELIGTDSAVSAATFIGCTITTQTSKPNVAKTVTLVDLP